MQLTQLRHAFNESTFKVFNCTCCQINMLQQTSTTTLEKHLKAYITVNTFTITVYLSFDQPDVTVTDTLQQSLTLIVRHLCPPIIIDVYTTLDPRKLTTRSFNKLNQVRVRSVNMQHNCAVFVHPTATKNLVQGRVDLPKRYGT